MRKSWLGNIRKVISVSPGVEVQFTSPQVVETNHRKAHRIRIVDDPSAPVYQGVWDESAYQSPQEILVGVLKSWRHDKASYASEADIWTLYEHRHDISLNEEKAECLVASAINRHAPFFFAKWLSKGRLVNFIEAIGKSCKYPAPNVVLRLAHAIGGQQGERLLDYVRQNCRYISVENTARKLRQTVSDDSRIRREYGFSVEVEGQHTRAAEAPTSMLERMLEEAVKEWNRGRVRQLDALLYAPALETRRTRRRIQRRSRGAIA